MVQNGVHFENIISTFADLDLNPHCCQVDNI